MLTIGDRFPDFKLQACVGLEKGKEFAEVTGDTYKGKWRVYFFWPLDFTFVCPTEIAEFGQRDAEFKERGTQVLGGSIDSQYVHLAWRNADQRLKNLPFPMLADVKHDLCAALGILHKDKGIALRATFIVDTDNVIRHVSVNDLSAGRNVDETLRILDAMQNGGLCPVAWKRGDKTL